MLSSNFRVLSDWTCGMQNLGHQHGFKPLRLDGTLPSELHGTLYRNVPAIFDQFGERVRHWFDPHAAVCAIRIRGGGAEGAVKVVETPGLIREQRAKKRMYARFGAPMVNPIREMLLGDRPNPAGTSILAWNGRLYATCEGAKPVEFRPETLETLGVRDFEGAIVHNFSAHTHDVPARNAAYNFGVKLGKNTIITVYELPYTGRARQIAQVTVPGAVTLHDFIVTRNHVVIPVPPSRVDMVELLKCKKGPVDCMRWRPELGTELIVIPLHDPQTPVRITVPAHHVEHVINAYEKDSRIIFDMTRYPNIEARDGYLRGLVHGVVEAPLGAVVSRGTLDLATRQCTYETRFDRPCELPRVSPRVDASVYRFAYAVGFSSCAAERDSFFDAIVKLDVDHGSRTEWVPGQGHFPSEPVFVGAGPDSEDDGYLLTLVLDGVRKQSYLAVLNARAIGDGPIARAYFDQVMPLGFHGAWVGAASA